MTTTALRSLLAEPRPAEAPPARVWRDWLLLGAVAVSLVAETVAREDLSWGPVQVVLVLILAGALLRRRTAPLASVAVMFGAMTLVTIAEALGYAPVLPYSLAWAVVVLPYALLRWGSGRDAVVGLAIMLVTAVLDVVVTFTGMLDGGVGIAILLLPAAVGASVRFRSNARRQELEGVKLLERQQLARELHDTVAHHVSAIAVQAQAGRVVAPTDPALAVEALRAIEEAASLALDEMRAVVGVLRAGQEADLAPQRGIADLYRLSEARGGPDIELHLTGELSDLSPALGATVYRLAQESITNAVRHARHAQRIDVDVVADADHVRLTVSDDGDQAPAAQTGRSYGLTGMRERALLLGGTLDAGPAPDGGWRVQASLPRTGVRT